jgi:nucleotide-binding universal stress UspA family protein
MSKRILVPVDGSRPSSRGLAEALKLARSQKARVCLLHVVDERAVALSPEAGGVYLDRLLNVMRESGKKILAQAALAARARGVKASTVLVENITRSVADVVIAQARKWHADLIVIGTHGRRGVSRLVMGSDAENVVRTAPVPVLLVRASTRSR